MLGDARTRVCARIPMRVFRGEFWRMYDHLLMHAK